MRKSFFIPFILLLTFCTELSAQWPSEKYRIPYPKPIKNTPDTVSVYIIGDVMMHSKQFTRDHRKFFKYVAGHMREADIFIANMELTLAGPPYTGYPAFSSPEYIADYMADDCGCDVFLTANNHVLDKGCKGLDRTLGIYDELSESFGVSYTGCAISQSQRNLNYPLMLSRKGINIAIINCTYGNNLGPDAEWPVVNNLRESEIHDAFERAEMQGADFIIAIPHWGVEYQLKHSDSQARWAKFFVNEGADAVIGGHPHVVQDTTHIKGVPVFYSLGNAVSNMSIINSRLELAVTLRFVHDSITGEKTMLEPQIDFMWCTLPGMLTDSYATIYVKEWANRRDDWLTPSDFDNMMDTWRRVKAATGIED